MCVKALVAAQNDIAHNPCCFDLYGFDVIIDEDLKSWLLEINSSPSLSCETMLDDLVKQRLIDDTIDLVQPIDFDRGRLRFWKEGFTKISLRASTPRVRAGRSK